MDCFLSAYPDVVTREISAEHEFILLACDGIWDVLTNQEVVDFVRARLAHRMDPERVKFCLGVVFFSAYSGKTNEQFI